MVQNILFPEDPQTRVCDPEIARKVDNAASGMLLLVVILTTIGLTMLYSASYGIAGMKFFRNQLIWVTLGTIGGLTVYLAGFRRVAGKCLWWIIAAVILLLITRFCYPSINGAYRWIRIRLPGMDFSIQPSEFAKVAVALYTAKYCADNFRTFNQLKWHGGIFPVMVCCGAAIGGILLGEDLGTTLLVSLLCFGILVSAGLNWGYWLIAGGAVTAMGTFVYFFNPTRMARVISFSQPELMRKEQGYQLWNSLLALGSGGWTGIGFMESRLKASYLPEAHTDFILAVIGEELGLTAMIFIILCYTLFGFFSFRIALLSSSRLGMFLGFGLSIGITVQALINIAVVTGSAPTKGMPAPFISYGGSNMIASLITIGLLMSIAAETVDPGGSDRKLNQLRHYFSFLPWWKKYRNIEVK